MARAPKGFEGSKFDDDRGVKEGSKADRKRDAKEIPAFLKARKKEKPVEKKRGR